MAFHLPVRLERLNNRFSIGLDISASHTLIKTTVLNKLVVQGSQRVVIYDNQQSRLQKLSGKTDDELYGKYSYTFS